ncbi:DUF6571 family protein [Actinomyces oris]|uniref:DUF6571 family protein n=1 Tax=Actinomyces oris TaxID=544580 RepID=UPI000AF66CCF|nr:DUF6571 family protein [Actinomyces oris]
MAVIKLHEGNLKKQISKLRSFATSCSDSRKRISDENTRQGHPSPSGAPDQFLSTSQTWIDGVSTAADNIERDMNAILNLNSNGLAVQDKKTGMITCTVPDNVVPNGTGTSYDLHEWADGQIDANDLKTILEGRTPKSGRTYDQVIAAMQANLSDKPEAYANGFVSKIGVENLTQIPFDVVDRFTDKCDGTTINSRPGAEDSIALLLGNILAAASRSWDENTSRTNAEKIVKSVNADGHYGRMTVLNSMLAFNKDDPEKTASSKIFGTPFLVQLGNQLEKVEQGTLDIYSMPIDDQQYRDYAEKQLGPILKNGSLNTLQGLIEAMADNPEAGAKWLAPDGMSSDDADIQRIRNIAKHYTLGDNGWTNSLLDLTERISRFGLIDTGSASSDAVRRAEQAAVTVSGVVNEVGESGAKLSKQALADVDQTLANYTAGVDRSIQEAGAQGRGKGLPVYVANSQTLTESFMKGMPPQALFSDYTLYSLLGQAGQDANGLKHLTPQLALIQQHRMADATAKLNETGNAATLEEAMRSFQRTEGYVTGAITQTATNNGADADARNKAWIDGLMTVTELIPGVDKYGKVVEIAADYAKSRAEEQASSALHNAFEHHAKDAAKSGATTLHDRQASANRTMMISLIQSGAITPEQLQSWDNKGAAASIIKPDGTLNYDKIHSTNSNDVAEVDAAFNHLSETFPTSSVSNGRNQLEESVADAYGDSKDGFDQGADRTTPKATTTNDNRTIKVDPNKFGDNK